MRRRVVALALATACATAACSRGDSATPTTLAPPTTPRTGGEPTVIIEGGHAVNDDPAPAIVLSDGGPSTLRSDVVPVVAGEPLPDEATTVLIDRLPEWSTPDPGDEDDFARPATRLDPPVAGTTVDAPFPPTGPPPDAPPETGPAGPLRVTRVQPEGAVDVAPFLAVTFDRPMVALQTVDQLAAVDVPVGITPTVAGRWRWIGTRTARFEAVPCDEPDSTCVDRLPAATEYTVTVPAGTTAADGSVLADEVSWTFTTPPPTVTSFTGTGEAMPLDPVFVAVFDQLVEPADVLATVRLLADGSPVGVRAATTAEVAADERAQAAAGAAPAGRVVAFRPDRELPADAAVTVEIGPGTPSAEGPRTTTEAARYTGRTHGPLRLTRHSCNHPGATNCVPGAAMTVEFSNELATVGLTQERVAELVTVEPELPGMRLSVWGNVVDIGGATAAETRYRVTFAAGLTDVFGQTLGEPATAEFEYGRGQPYLRGFDRPFLTLDPLAPAPTVSVQTLEHESVHVTVWAVGPDQIGDFRALLERSWRDAEPAWPDWPVLLDTDVPVTPGETTVDLSAAFSDGRSQVVVRLSSNLDIGPRDNLWYQNQPSLAWVQRTTLGIDAFHDGDRLVVWTNDLVTGAVVPDVRVELGGRGSSVTTDAEGLAVVDLAGGRIDALWADAGQGRTALLVQDWWGGWEAMPRGAESRWYVVDDRTLYRPGETARVAGWVRRLDPSADSRLALYDGAVEVRWTAHDGYGNEIGSGTAPLNRLGGFRLAVDVPATAHLGAGWIQLTLAGPAVGPAGSAAATHPLRIEEYRRPEFEVAAHAVDAPPHFVAGGATVAVDATYYAGGPLAGAEVRWLVGSTAAAYAPPGWDDYHFGEYRPWWWVADVSPSRRSVCADCGPYGPVAYEEFTGRTDADGSHRLTIAFDRTPDDTGTEPPATDLPRSVTAEATVFDVNRQAWTATTDLLVHPARNYIGVRSARGFVEAGAPLVVDAIVTDVDGAVSAGRDVTITVNRVDWVWSAGTTTEQLTEIARCEATSADAPIQCRATPDLGGQYRIVAVVTDADGNPSRSELTVWVAGGTGRPTRRVEQQQVTIVPSADEYAPGDAAELLVQAPFAPASGIYVLSHGGVREAHAFDAPDGSAVLRIPIGDDDVPNLVIDVEMTGSSPRVDDAGAPVDGAPARPAYAAGRIDLPVSLAARTLTVTADPARAVAEPGSAAEVNITVTDADGEPVAGADVALVVVDEAVLALTGFDLGDPLDVFYRPLDTWLGQALLRSTVVLDRTDSAGRADGGDDTTDSSVVPLGAPAPAAAEMAADAAGGAARSATTSAPIEVRADFDAVAAFEPALTTGPDGSVTFPFDLPDSLTRYRVMAVAVDGATRFGKGESSLTARLPLMVRPSAPRFANFGDRFELPVVLQNQTDDDLVVDVALETANLTAPSSAGRRVVVPAGDRVEVRFPVEAAAAGTARYRVAAGAGAFVDAVEGSFPVYTPATAEAFATYGVLDADAAIGVPVVAPTDVWAEFGGLEITTSSTAVASLTDAVLYLADYPYDSADGIAARVLAIATLRDVLAAFGAEGVPTPAELDAAVERDVARLASLRNDDGGWAWWQRGRPSDPWVSVVVTHALTLARQEGYPVGDAVLDPALAYLAEIERHLPDAWGAEARAAVRAYAVYVRGEAGRRDPAEALAVYREFGDHLQLDAIAWLWPSIDDAAARTEIERTLHNRAVDTAGAASFATEYGETAHLVAHSDRRTDAVVLDALLTQAPGSDLVPKVVAGLMAGQTRGRWTNVYENAFALVALHRYFATFESVTPDFVARVWLGADHLAEHEFAGRTTDRSRTVVPMQDLLAATDAGGTPLTLAVDGSGRLYYRLGLRYAPAQLQLGARDEGFVVDRVYEAVDDPGDVWQDDDGTWHVAAGAQVRVRLTMVADAVRTHVALVDPLPAGLEARNPALATTGTIRPGDGDDAAPLGRSWFWWGPWWEHANLGDDRVEVIAGWIDGGTYEYSYVARATTPGEFVVPPARAEMIYAPETFGRSASDRLVVESAG